MNQKADPISRLETILGFDPVSRQPNGSVLQEALKEITEEREANQKEEAKKLLMQAVELRQEQQKVKSQYEAAAKKFDKTLGKMLNRIEAMANGQPAPTEEETTE